VKRVAQANEHCLAPTTFAIRFAHRSALGSSLPSLLVQSHLHLHQSVLIHHDALEGVSVLLEEKERGDGDISAASIVSHDGFNALTAAGSSVVSALPRVEGITGTDIVCNEDSGRSGNLGLPDLLDKRTGIAVDHEDERCLPSLR